MSLSRKVPEAQPVASPEVQPVASPEVQPVAPPETQLATPETQVTTETEALADLNEALGTATEEAQVAEETVKRLGCLGALAAIAKTIGRLATIPIRTTLKIKDSVLALDSQITKEPRYDKGGIIKRGLRAFGYLTIAAVAAGADAATIPFTSGPDAATGGVSIIITTVLEILGDKGIAAVADTAHEKITGRKLTNDLATKISTLINIIPGLKNVVGELVNPASLAAIMEAAFQIPITGALAERAFRELDKNLDPELISTFINSLKSKVGAPANTTS